MNQRHIVIIFVILTILGLGAAGVNSIKSTLTQNGITPTPGLDVTITPNEDKQDQNILSTQSQNNNLVSITPVVSTKKQYRQFPGNLASEELKDLKADIETSKGTISFEIYPEATKAASNFIFLARDGFYDNLTFHRIVPGFVIQGGDPFGTGMGGPGYNFDDEPVVKQYLKGIVAMANSGPNTNGSQFFIMLENNLQLPPKYTIFGKVIKGQDIVDKIQIGDVMRKVIISSLNNPEP